MGNGALAARERVVQRVAVDGVHERAPEPGVGDNGRIGVQELRRQAVPRAEARHRLEVR
jgi:hypothetical protein